MMKLEYRCMGILIPVRINYLIKATCIIEFIKNKKNIFLKRPNGKTWI